MANSKPLTVNLSSKKITIDLGLITVFLAILSLAGQILKYTTNYEEAFGLIPLVNMAKTLSIPTIFTVLVVFIITVLLGLISIIKFRERDKFRFQWVGLTIFFFLFTLDKGSTLSSYFFKQFRGFMRGFFPAYPNQKWVTTAVILLTLIIIFYRAFIQSLPRATKKQALISFAVYYAGFLFIERFSDHFAAVNGYENLEYSILVTAGKTLSLFGLILCIQTLFDYLSPYQIETAFSSNDPGKSS